jgi:hypothetical protein
MIRTKVVKELTEVAPAWANGCSDCTYGIHAAPLPTHVVETYLERLVQFREGSILFCTCRAGQMRKAQMMRELNRLLKETATRPLFAAIPKDTHVDLENARTLIQQARKADHHE